MFDLSFYFLKPSHNLFVNDIIPPLLLKTRYVLYAVTCTRLYILLSFIEIIKTDNYVFYEHVDTRIFSLSEN